MLVFHQIFSMPQTNFADGQNQFLLVGSAPTSNSLSAQMISVLMGIHPPVQLHLHWRVLR